MNILATNIDAALPAFEKFGRQINPSDDPTKTKGLRARWVAAVRRRWNIPRAWVTETVVKQDAFGLRGPGGIFAQDAPAEQIARFMAALRQVENESIDELVGGFRPWITPFVAEGFGKGVIRGNRDLVALAKGQRREVKTQTGNALRVVNAELFEAPTLDPANVQDALQAGERARLFELEITRTWAGITNVTAQTNGQIAMVIADALETRATPAQLAKDINGRIDAIGKTRSEMIARTETVAANNRGAVAEFAEAERLTGFDVLVQWETSLDSRVRDTHIVRHGKVYTRDEYRTLISEPNCRCAGLPYIPAIEGEVDPASGRAARDLTPKEAKGPAKRKREQLDTPLSKTEMKRIRKAKAEIERRRRKNGKKV